MILFGNVLPLVLHSHNQHIDRVVYNLAQALTSQAWGQGRPPTHLHNLIIHLKVSSCSRTACGDSLDEIAAVTVLIKSDAPLLIRRLPSHHQ